MALFYNFYYFLHGFNLILNILTINLLVLIQVIKFSYALAAYSKYFLFILKINDQYNLIITVVLNMLKAH